MGWAMWLGVVVTAWGVLLVFRAWQARARLLSSLTRAEFLEKMKEAEESNPFFRHSAQELAALIRTGEATSECIVESHIKHILKVNVYLNAMVQNRFRLALEEARAADALVQQFLAEGRCLDTLPVLHGVPFTVKECFALTGMPNASGLASRREIVSPSDATVVRRLRGESY